MQVCGQSFVLEALLAHVGQDHSIECPFKMYCWLKFVHQYHLDIHLFLEHRVGKMPNDMLRPKEELVNRTIEENMAVDKEEVVLEDLEVGD